MMSKFMATPCVQSFLDFGLQNLAWRIEEIIEGIQDELPGLRLMYSTVLSGSFPLCLLETGGPRRAIENLKKDLQAKGRDILLDSVLDFDDYKVEFLASPGQLRILVRVPMVLEEDLMEVVEIIPTIVRQEKKWYFLEAENYDTILLTNKDHSLARSMSNARLGRCTEKRGIFQCGESLILSQVPKGGVQDDDDLGCLLGLRTENYTGIEKSCVLTPILKETDLLHLGGGRVRTLSKSGERDLVICEKGMSACRYRVGT